MKTLLAVLAIIGALLVYKVYNPVPAPQPQQQVVYAPAPTPTPKAAPTPVPRRLAPEGTFFVTQYVSVRTPTGVAGFEPGREVRFVGVDEAKQTLIVTDGQYKVELGPTQLTNDLDVAAMAQRQDQASQNQLAAIMASEQAADQRVQQANAIKSAQEMSRSGQHNSAIGNSHSVLGEKSEPASAADRAAIRYGNPYYYLHRRYYATPVVSSLQSVGGG